ncbi:sugar ABC transporter ATP-binding protein [Acerihabitans sp.]|uniref:sugar ABC transporter ATP-binding protein n=1 Tax=Acerihabitans sp. TaxID=2811394 RepID=UPI002EDA88D5
MQQSLPQAAAGTQGMRLTSVSKSYGATVALESVSLTIEPGQVQAILGENGAGKSTLVKILSGVVTPNTGIMTLEGQNYAPRSLLQARHIGVSTAFQELSLLPNLSVAQNFFLPRSLKQQLIITSPKQMTRRAEAILADHGVQDISPHACVDTLSLAARQRVEIVRAMHYRPRLLLLDEPTGALADVDWLFRLIRRLTAQGTAVLYISHRLAEIREIASHAMVLRSGKTISTVDLKRVTNADIFEMMVGRRSTHAQARGRPSPSHPPGAALTANDLGGQNFSDISFELRRGEILGVAGLEGQGQRELFRTLAGLMRHDAGQMLLRDREVILRSPRHALGIHGGVAFVPEDRKSEGIFPTLSAGANITQSMLHHLSRLGFIRRDKERRAVKSVAPRVELDERYLSFKISALSGGNQQKALIARALLTGASTLLLFDPTRGVDVGTKEVIYQAIKAFVDNGGAVLIYSTDLAELQTLVDRCLVMYRGRIVADLPRDKLDEGQMVGLMTGNTGE